MENARQLRRILRDDFPGARIPFRKWRESLRQEEARLTAFLAEARNDPRKAEHFWRIVEAKFSDRLGEIRKAIRESDDDAPIWEELWQTADDDYLWSVEEREARIHLAEIRELRKCIELASRLSDEDDC
jgi:hypothetical protein